MKKIAGIGITVIFLLMPFSFFVVADGKCNSNQVIVNYTFEMPIIENSNLNNQIYGRIVMFGSVLSGNPSEPYLPTRGAYILIPYGEKIREITVTLGEKVYLGSNINIKSVGELAPSSIISSSYLPTTNKVIYGSTYPSPEKLFTQIGTYSFRGYNILVLKLHPVQYVPSTGELFYYRDMDVCVETAEDATVNSLFRGLNQDKIEVMRKVDNPAAINTYPTALNSSQLDNDYDLLIITRARLKDGFIPLKAAHDAEGIHTIIKTLSDIGSTTPEEIRDYIKEAYTNWGIGYVLLGGDDNVIPSRDLWVQTRQGQAGVSTTMPSDLYYACLDGTFNYDDDDRWGEPTDGLNGGDVDLMAEVFVGRASVSNIIEVNNFVKKTTSYMSTSPDDNYLKNVLMVGQHKAKFEAAKWGGNFLDELLDECSSGNYTTIGIPSNKYSITTLYDRDWQENHWPKPRGSGAFGGWPNSKLIMFINKDTPYLINHNGHGLKNNAMKLWNLGVFRMKNTKYFFAYSSACFAGHFDGVRDCFAEYLTVKTDHGAFAVIMNAREGFSSINSTDSPSQRFHREFWDAVFGENITVISKANQDSKEDNLWRIDEEYMRWCYYETNLLGDPTVYFKI